MVERLADGLISAYQSFLKKSRDEKGKSHDQERMPITQTRALRLLFDVRFITGVLPKKEEADVSRELIMLNLYLLVPVISRFMFLYCG